MKCSDCTQPVCAAKGAGLPRNARSRTWGKKGRRGDIPGTACLIALFLPRRTTSGSSSNPALEIAGERLYNTSSGLPQDRHSRSLVHRATPTPFAILTVKPVQARFPPLVLSCHEAVMKKRSRSSPDSDRFVGCADRESVPSPDRGFHTARRFRGVPSCMFFGGCSGAWRWQ